MADLTALALPPSTDRGVDNLVGLGWRPDFLTASFAVPEGRDETAWALQRWHALGLGPSTRRKLPHFGDGVALDRGGAVMAWAGHGDAHGVATLTLTGKFWVSQADPANLLAELLVGMEGRARRLDLCADFDGDGVPGVMDLCRAIETGAARLAARHAVLQRTILGHGGSTLYLGATSSVRRVRIYDVRGPLRVELQYRDDAAEDLATAVLREGCEVAWGAEMARLASFPTVAGWDALMRTVGGPRAS